MSNNIKLNAKVRFKTPRNQEVRSGTIVSINSTARGEWYEILIDGEKTKTVSVRISSII